MAEAQQKHFSEMAERMALNDADSFGGAFVIVPPDGGDPLSTLILDNKQDSVQFWILLKTKCETEIAMLDQKQRTNQGFGRR